MTDMRYAIWDMRWLIILLVLCHQFNVAQQSPHGKIESKCETCHSTESWKMRADASFNHNSTGFALEGKHKFVSCQSCHQKLEFTKVTSECASCHTDVHKSEFGTNCLRCHSNDSWLIPDMKEKHQQTRFPLLGNHAFVTCEACHERASTNHFAGTPLECVACHQKEYQATTTPSHEQVKFPVDCIRCHKVTASWTSGFDHNLTTFPLTGAHQTTICSQCHVDNKFLNLTSDCYSCHSQHFAEAQSPNHVAGELSHDCKSCHTTSTWRPSTFDHSETQFSLTGKHFTTECQACHKNGNYNLTYSNCVQCHQTDFQQATNPNHQTSSFNQNCQSCHSTSNWQTTTFDHTTTTFALTGAHQVVLCSSCHTNNNFQLTYSKCYQCHQTDFQQVLNPNHVNGGFDQTCQPCHSTSAWKPATFNHDGTNFSLTGRHAYSQCQSCHQNGNYNLTYSNCVQCHQTDFQQATNPNHQTSSFNENCVSCHSTDGWSPASIDHSTTSFPLTGSHIPTQCSSCHVSGNYQLTYSNCYQCHQTDYQQVAQPNHVTGVFNYTCEPCHSTSSWTPSLFNHGSTNFALTGSHIITQCQQCHSNGNYNLTYTDCYQCHQTDFQEADDPDHVGGGFSHDCQTCHSTSSWEDGTFSHNTTNFPLTGQHTTTLCQSCHVNGNYNLIYSNCIQCHQTDYQQTTNPNHQQGTFGQECQTCHETSGWSPATYNHDATNFALTGRHAYTQCQSCHENGDYQLTYSNCYQCHQTDFQQATNPNHQTNSFNQNCVSCHSTDGWSPASFDHTTTAFALTGSHMPTQCSSCHVSGNYLITYSNCYQCHQTEYQQVTEPNHVSGVFSYTCEPCHSTSVWTPSLFNHSNTNFALSGQHITTLCQSCHQNGNYNFSYTDCFQCHQTNYNQATNPDHQSGNFNHDCTQCHSTSGWSPATFDHSTTNFPLTGQHVSADCQSCHVNGNYNLSYTDCYQCHQTEFDGTTNPNHVAGNYNHDCTECHTTSGWSPASFDHAPTNFQLTGSHLAVQCLSCHTGGNFQLTYTNCYVCHQTDYQTPTNPNHVTNVFDYLCQPCHTTNAWSPSVFNHSTTALPLTGAHTSTTCVSCHSNGNYQLTYTDCYPCHQTDYQQPTNPNHVQANFAHECSPCHTTSVWTPSTLNHDTRYFKIKTGKHRGKWTLCTECHTTPTNYGTFSCIDCHEHNRTDTDRDHREVSGYTYVSSECYRCHRND